MQKCKKVEGDMTTNSRFYMRKKKPTQKPVKQEKKPYRRQQTDNTVEELGVWKAFHTKALQWETKVAMDEHTPLP